MVKRAAVVAIASIFLMHSALARGKAEITFGPRQAPGVLSQAQRYAASSSSTRAVRVPTSAGSIVAGPILVPLAGMVQCGHDPRWAGGLTCALPPPEPQVAGRRVRRNQEDPEAIARRFMDRAIALAPKPKLRITPRRRGLAGLESYFFLAERPRPIRAQANAGGFTVTAEARPIQYIWTFGDGSDTVTRHHGRRWTKKRPGNIDHVYETKRRYRVRVEVIWRARWRIGLGPWRTLGYFTNADSARYRVGELVPVLVKSS